MKVIPATEKTKDGVNTYDIIIGTELIFDYKNKKVFYCTKDDESHWSYSTLILDIEGIETTFYIIDTLSYDVVKDMAEVIRIHEMENDLDYMKSQGEKAFDCSDCDHKQGYVNVEPCKSCKNYCNHSKNKKDKSYNEVVNDFVPPVDGQQCPSWVNPTTYNTMQNLQKNINNFFANYSKPKTLNTKTGCLEDFDINKLGPIINPEEGILHQIKPLNPKWYKEPGSAIWMSEDEMKKFADSDKSSDYNVYAIRNGFTKYESDGKIFYYKMKREHKPDIVNHISQYLENIKKLYNL